MPYDSITDLPDAVRSRYSERCQGVFLRTFNRSYERMGEADAMKVAHTAAGMCKGAGKAETGTAPMLPMKAAPLDDGEMAAWFAGKAPRRMLVIPFGGPVGRDVDGVGRDVDIEYFDERTDIKADWFPARPMDWHHSQDPTGLMNGVTLGKADRLGTEDGAEGEPDQYGWWADTWLHYGERKLAALKALVARGAELFGSTYAYPNLIKRGKAGHIDVWPYMIQTLSTAPQNRYSAFRPAKAVLDAFTQADIAVEPILRDVLTELDVLRNLPPTLSSRASVTTGDGAAKAGRELSGSNLAEIEEWLEMLDGIAKRAKSLRDRVRVKYASKKEGVPSAS